MSERLTIALDAMGGDDAPRIVLQGADIALERFPDARFLLFGDESAIAALLEPLPKVRAASEIRHTPDRITGDSKPSTALRSGRKSSMWLAIAAVRDGEAHAVVSAGNTGALMAVSKFLLRMPRGVDRPAIASFFPTMRGESVMLDLGANLDCDANNLVQFAVLGASFARAALGIANPSVGLLNVGSEELKGHEEIRQAAAIMRETPLPLDFRGFVEGNDITSGKVDVVVTDGFTGNAALKAAEGVAKLYGEFLKRAFRSSILASIGYLLARGALAKLRARLDPRRYNGAVFLGLNGVAVKSHGGSDAFGFANAIGVAIDMVKHDFLGTIRTEFERLSPDPALAAAAAVPPSDAPVTDTPSGAAASGR